MLHLGPRLSLRRNLNFLTDARPARLLALQWVQTLNQPLSETDPELFDIMEREKLRQRQSVVLIASEVNRF